jgi:hypothetical protein
MKGYYWDFRVCRWVRCTVAAQVDELLPEQRSEEAAEAFATAAGTVPLSPTP